MKLYIQLGKTGDILNILPLLWLDAQAGNRSALMVAKDYAGLLDGVGYCDKVVFDGHAAELERAIVEARSWGWKELVCTQVIGPEETVRKCTYQPAGLAHAVTTSYQKEAWRVAGKLAHWDSLPPLVFDKRDAKREAALLGPPRPGKKLPVILVAAESDSSPFPHKELLWYLLRHEFRTGYRLVDLSTVKAERFYDLLVLFESAHCLVAVDSAPLHLAWACRNNLPVVALTQDQPLLWRGSAWRPNHVFYCRYGDFPKRCLDMLRVIGNLEPWECLFPKEPCVVHVFNAYEGNGKSFNAFDGWCPTPIEPGSCGRDSAMPPVSDSRRLPWLKDALRMGLQRADSEDLVCLTKPGVEFAEGIASRLTGLSHPVWSHRMERGQDGDTHHPALDLFAAQKSWWESHLREIPDLLLGSDYEWSAVLKEIMRRDGGRELIGATYKTK